MPYKVMLYFYTHFLSIFSHVLFLFIWQGFGESLVCVGESDEPSADGDWSWAAQRLADHAGACCTAKLWNSFLPAVAEYAKNCRGC